MNQKFLPCVFPSAEIINWAKLKQARECETFERQTPVLSVPRPLSMHQLAVQEHVHQISIFPVNDWSSRALAGHLENISLERRGPFVA